VQFFLTKAIDINHQNNEGYAPLHRASGFGQPHVVKILLEHKANFLLTDNKGLTPEKIAKDEESKKILAAARQKKDEEESANQRSRQAQQNAAVGFSSASGGGGGGFSVAAIAPLITEVVAAINKQTAEIAKLREAVEHLTKK